MFRKSYALIIHLKFQVILLFNSVAIQLFANWQEDKWTNRQVKLRIYIIKHALKMYKIFKMYFEHF